VLPATKKILEPLEESRDPATGTFPLWSRRESYGVVSVYLGSEERPYIVSDRVTVGATAYFNGLPDLEIVEFGESRRHG